MAAYLTQLSRFAQLKLDGLPHFETRDSASLSDRRKNVFLSNDAAKRHNIHVTPTHLGRFEGYASIKMTNAQLQDVASLPRAALWNGFCQAFQVKDSKKCMLWESSLFWRNLYRSGSFISKPMRLFDYRWTAADTVDEIEDAVRALKSFQKEKTPEKKQAALRNLFATEYPVERVEGILRLADLSKIPRSVELETQPKGNASDKIKEKFKSINGHRFTGEKGFPPPARYDSAKETASKFDPANLAFVGSKPRVKKITLYKEDPPARGKSKQRAPTPEKTAPILATTVSVSKIGTADHINVYIKLEQAGKLQLAKLKLIEDVIDIPIPDDFTSGLPDRVNFTLKLSGQQSILANLISEESLSLGGDFKLTMAISANGLIWSDEKSLEFRIEAGQLRPQYRSN